MVDGGREGVINNVGGTEMVLLDESDVTYFETGVYILNMN